MVFVKAGTLDESCRERVRPDVHIFVKEKVEWVDLGKEVEKGVKVCEEFYVHEDVWTEESLERRKVLRAWRERQEEQEKQ